MMIIYSLLIVSSVFPTMLDGLFLEGILLFGIFLVKNWKVVNPQRHIYPKILSLLKR